MFNGSPSRAPKPAGRLIWMSVVMLGLTACHRAPPAPSPVALVVALPVRHDPGTGGGDAIRYPVEVGARYSNTMSFRVPGKLIERSVRLGDRVKQGQVIARLDPIDAQKQAASAKAALEAAEHRLIFAKQQLDRDLAQSQQNLIAANQLEQTQDAYTAALSGRDQADAQLVVARNNLQYNTLVADHDGLITSENADTGQVVSAGQAVYGLAWSGDTDVILDAAESDLGRIAVGQSAAVTFPALPGQQYEAHVREISPAADPQSRTYRVKLTLKEPTQAVRLGMTGDATLEHGCHECPAGSGSAAGSPVAQGAHGSQVAQGTDGSRSAQGSQATLGADGSQVAPGEGGSQGTYTVPATAIFHKDNSPAVWLIDSDNSLQLRPVKVRSYSDRKSVVSSGLKDGDVVVLAGVHTVYAGQHVKAVKPLFDSEGDIEGPATTEPEAHPGAVGR
jgi:membrane fusion protein, multidrug efflux system